MKNGIWMYLDAEFPQGEDKQFPVIAFRKKINLKHNVLRAKISITAKGVYTLYVNGRRVSDSYLAPGWSDYRKELLYQEYNLSEYLCRGENVIVIELASGWYYGTMGLLNEQAYGKRGAVLYELVVDFRNGNSLKYHSDRFHKVGYTHIVTADILDGETWDFHLPSNYAKLDFDDSSWQDACEETCDLTLKKQDYEPVECDSLVYPKIHSEKGKKRIYDFGENFAGVVEATVKGADGTTVRLRYAEVLDGDGSLYTRNLRRAKSTDLIVCDGNLNKFAPRYVYHGFRFVEVVTTGEIEKIELRGKKLTSAFKPTLEITTSNNLVNDIVKAITATMKANFLAVPTDCPQRDERLGWLGDICAFGGSAMYLADCEKYLRKYLGDIRNAQREDGNVYNVAPYVQEVAGWGHSGWGDAIVILTYDHYCMYGDRTVIEENMPAMKAWVDFLVNDSKHFLRKGDPLAPADWLALDFTEKQLVNTAYCYYSASLLANMCEFMGDTEQGKYEKIAQSFKNAFCGEYVRGNELTVKTQGAYALAIAFGLAEANDLKDSFEAIMRKDNYHITTGFLSTRFLLYALCDIGRTDLAYKLLTNSDYPSWGHMLLNGGTTIWERWNGITGFYGSKVFEDYAMNSFCHYALGAIVEWLVEYMFGLKILPDLHTVLIQPRFDPLARIKEGKCTLHTKFGKIKVAFTYQETAVRYDIELDENASITFQPGDIIELIKKKGNQYTAYYRF